MFYCLNNEPTAWSRVLREKLPVPQLVRNYPHFMVCKCHLSFVPIMSQLNLNRIEITNKMRPCSRSYCSNVS